MTSSSDAVAQGVCGGFAKYFGIDPLWIRLAVFLVAFLTGFVAVGAIYVLLAWLMPSDEEEVPTAADLAEPQATKPIDLWPFFLAVGRLALALVLGLSIGLLIGGLGIALLRPIPGFDLGILAGVAAGLFTAAVTGWLFLRATRSVLLNILLALLLGGSAGIASALAMLWSGGVDFVAELAGGGMGCLVAGVAICLNMSFSRWIWRFFPPLLLGIGGGLMTGAVAVQLLGVHHEAPAALGIGAGLLVCGATAWLLFFCPLVITAPAKGGDPSWAAAGNSSGNDSTGIPSEVIADTNAGMPTAARILIALAVVLAAGPISLHLINRNPSNMFYVPKPTPANSSHVCNESLCRSSATTLVSLESYAAANIFQSKNYCEVHARKAIWEASQKGAKHKAFDIVTGKPRADLDPSDIDVFEGAPQN